MTTAPIAPAAGQSAAIVDYLDVAEPAFVDLLSECTREAIKKQLAGSLRHDFGLGQFFNDLEQLRLTYSLATTIAISDLIGRARIQLQADAELRDHPEYYDAFNESGGDVVPWTAEQLRELFTPRAALEFFRKIAGITGKDIANANLFETLITGRAFSIAATADTVIRERVARVIEHRIETGNDIRGGGRVIDEILDSSGIAHTNGYGQMIARTNTMEAYNQGAWSRFKDPDLDGLMVVWKYIGIRDGRQRQGPEPKQPDHRAKCGRYYPRSVDFQDIRGRAARDVINCRCSFVAKTKRQWARLQADGAKLEAVPIPTWPMG